MAMRTAVQYWRELGKPHKTHVLGRTTSYHGMTLGALSMSGHAARRKDYGDLLHAFNIGPTPVSWERNDDAETLEVERPEDWLQVIEAHGAQKVAALIVEPIIGAAGGVLVPAVGHLRELRRMCDRLDILLIADEIITGLGRTGSWFACDHDGVVPDMIAVGKGLTSGYTPMAALLLHERIVASMRAGSGSAPFGHTFSGNPLSAATSLAVLRYLQEHNLPDKARENAPRFEAGLKSLAARYPSMANVRGRGMLWGFDLRHPGTGAPPAADQPGTAAFVADCFAAGLVIYPAGIPPRNAAIVSPPLTITTAEIKELFSRLETGLRRFTSRYRG